MKPMNLQPPESIYCNNFYGVFKAFVKDSAENFSELEFSWSTKQSLLSFPTSGRLTLISKCCLVLYKPMVSFIAKVVKFFASFSPSKEDFSEHKGFYNG